MGKKVSVYLSSEALDNLDSIQEFVRAITGCAVSRSSALNALLVKGAGLFMEDQQKCRAAVAKYTKGPLMQKALRIAREESVRSIDLSLYDRDKDHGDTDEEAAG